MTDEPAEPEPLSEAATPGRSLRGAAEDLSSLFGQEYEPDPGATALGPQRPAGGAEDRLGRNLEAVTQRIAFLESELAGTVERVQSVDRHLASTYQALQAVLEKMPEAGDAAAGSGSLDLAPVESRLDTLAADVGRSVRGLRDQIDALRGRLMSFAGPGAGASPGLEGRMGSVEAALTAIAGRLATVEDRVASTLSHAESARDGLARLERSVEALHTAIGAGPAAPARGDALPDETASVPDTPILEDPLLAQLEERGAAGAAAIVEEIPTSARRPSPLRPGDAPDADAPPDPPEARPFWSSPGGS